MTAALWVFGTYFLALFALGYWALRRTRDESDYWIAGGRLGWLTGGATLAATHASAGTFIGTVGVIYTVGWSFGWLVLTIPAAYWFMAAVLAPRFTRVRELTLPAFLEARYRSRGVRVGGALIILVATVVYIQAQVVAGGLVANTLFGIPTLWGMTGFTVLLVVYTMVGGMVAVVYTDILQLAVMTLGAMAAVPLALRQVDGMAGLLAWVQTVDPATFEWGALPGPLLFTMAIAFTLGSVSTPEKLVRLYAMKDMVVVRRGILVAVVLTTAMNLLVFLLALAARVLFPALPTGDLAMPLVATTVLPGVLGALMLAAVTAAMMSTVDSLLLVAGSALAHDLYGPDVGGPPGDRGGGIGAAPPAGQRGGGGGARTVHRAPLLRPHGGGLLRSRGPRRLLGSGQSVRGDGVHGGRRRYDLPLGGARVTRHRSGAPGRPGLVRIALGGQPRDPRARGRPPCTLPRPAAGRCA
jgi:Na+/proline symporter